MAVAVLLGLSAVLVSSIGAVSGCGGRIGSDADVACQRTVSGRQTYYYTEGCGYYHQLRCSRTGYKYVTRYVYWCHDGYSLTSDRTCVPCGGCNVRTPTEQPVCPVKYTMSEKQSYRTYYHVKCGTWGWGRCTRSRTSYRTVYKEQESSDSGCCPPFLRCQGSCIAASQCSLNPCKNGGSCAEGCDGYTCTCRPGYTGRDCQSDIDECVTGGDTCEQLCTNTDGSYQCDCRPGYSLNADGRYCSEINECVSSPCENGGLCNDAVNGFICDCVPGYTGDNCQTDVDDCAAAPCENGGTCEDKINDYTCSCVDGYTGKDCETNLNEDSKTNETDPDEDSESSDTHPDEDSETKETDPDEDSESSDTDPDSETNAINPDEDKESSNKDS